MAVTRALLEQRWSALRRHLDDAGLNGLLLAGRGILASYGYVVYAAGYTPLLRHSYVYIDADREPTFWVPSTSDEAIVREQGLIGDVRATGESDWRGAAVPMAEAVAREIAGRNPARVGVVGLGAIVPPADEELLRRLLDGVELVDATHVAQATKEHKNAAELVGVRDAAELAREAYDAAPSLLRPGVAAQHVVAALEHILRRAGALELIVFCDRGPHVARRVTETLFQPGDLVSVLVEVATADGYWVEIGGLFSLGAPSDEAARLAAACYAALERVTDRCVPNAPIAEAAAQFDEVAAENELTTGLGLGHGVGIDHDRPLLSASSDGSFESGHVVSIHPNFITADVELGAIVADGIIVGDPTTPERISGLEPELTVLDT